MTRRFAAYLSCGLIAASAGVLFFQPPPRTALPTPTPRLSPSGSFATKPVQFSDVSLQWRLHLKHKQTAEQLTALTETLGSGVCIIDANRDGWMDVFFVGGSGHTRHYGRKAWWHPPRGNRLLLNKEGLNFEDVTERAGLHTEKPGMGCAVADLDNDGLRDLIVTGVGNNLLYRNKGDLTFEDATADSGIGNDVWSTGASVADFDGDGLLDIYITNYVLFEKGARTFEKTSGFQTMLNGAFDPTLYNPAPNRLYLNLGGWRFRDVAEELGVSNSLGRSLGARWLDGNGDSWPDLLVINDSDSPNQLYLSEGGEAFSRVGNSHSPFEVGGAHDVAIADFNGDGTDEVLMTRGMGSPPVLLSRTDAHGEYTDVAWSRGLARSHLLPFSGWGAASADFNNDGFLDLYVANGSLLPDADSEFVPQAQPNSLFLGASWGQFHLQTTSADQQYPHSSRAAVPVDLDNDGQLELLVTNNNDVLQVLAADKTGGNWLLLDLTPSFKDVEIFGARLTVQTENRTIRRSLSPPMGFLSQGDMRIHVGLGEDAEIRKLRLDWRDGTSTVFEDVPLNRLLVVDGSANDIRPRANPNLPSFPAPDALAELDDPALLSLFRLMSPNAARNRTLVEAIWERASARGREAVLEHLRPRRDILHLSLLKQALRDPSPRVRLRAVAFLADAEIETSVPWLIPLLDDEDPAVGCAVAEAFRSFFEKEEAVIHRKQLAVSPLIRQLEAGDAEVSVCAANALAAAESNRAVLPLIHRAHNSSDIEQRAAAIRALGLVRDRRALTPLYSLIEDSSSDAKTVATSLIALSRLGDPDPLDRFFEPEGGTDDSDVARHLDVLSELFTESDGVIFSKSRLQTRLQQLVEGNIHPSPESENQRRNRIAVIRAVGAGKSITHQNTVVALIDSPDPETRTEAFVALALLNSPATRELFETRLLEEPLATLRAVIQRLGQTGHAFSRLFVSAMAGRDETFPDALAILQAMPTGRASPIFDALLGEELDEARMLSLLETCAASRFTPAYPDRARWARGSPEMRIRYAKCFLRRVGAPSAKSLAPKSSLITRHMLTSILSEPQWDADTRASLIIMAAQNDEFIARTLLPQQIGAFPDRWLPDAHRALIAHSIVEPREAALWDLLRGEQYSPEVRLLAAELLATVEADTTRDYVRDQFLTK